MSDEEFLKRWSRRKQRRGRRQSLPSSRFAAGEVDVAASDVFETGTEPDIDIDLSQLPSLEEITATTDITEFLRKGVPAELGRAALVAHGLPIRRSGTLSASPKMHGILPIPTPCPGSARSRARRSRSVR